MNATPRTPKFTIAILTYNRCHLLRALLLSLEHIRYQPLQIIVVDNHSDDGTQQMMAEFKGVTYLRTEANIGASARNLGLRQATGDFIVTIDDDISGLSDEALVTLSQIFARSQKTAAITFRVIDEVTGETCNWVHHCKSEDYCDKDFMTYEITEGAVAFRRTALEQCGYYPDYFFLSHEGPDLAFRLMNREFDVMYTGSIVVKHSRSTLGRKIWLNYYFDTRNQLWLAARNLPFLYASLYLARGLISMFAYSVRDGYLRYWIKGCVDGLRGIRRPLGERQALTSATMRRVRGIDRYRPDILYQIRRRLFRRDVRTL